MRKYNWDGVNNCLCLKNLVLFKHILFGNDNFIFIKSFFVIIKFLDAWEKKFGSSYQAYEDEMRRQVNAAHNRHKHKKQVPEKQ